MRALLLLIAFIPFLLQAQHCAFDFHSIIVVRPHAHGDTTIIDGLRITLIEKDNLPATATGTSFYLFTRNNEPHERVHRRTFRRQGRRAFPFAQDNYILVVPNHFHMDNYKILVQDERPGADPRYRYQVMHMHPRHCYRLCGRYDEAVYPAGADGSTFAPIDITLFPQ